MGKGGLSGALKAGWHEPGIEVGGQNYTWERLGNLLLMLDEDLAVTIKVRPMPRARGK